MKPTRGYYCIIQYCPDLGRLEAANIGVLLFCPDLGILEARTSSDNARIRHFFGDEGHDWARINSYKRGIEERLKVEREGIKTLEALESFIAQRANLIQISPPRPMKVRDPEKDLDQLFEDLVGGRAQTKRGPNLKQFLGRKFASAGLDPVIRREIPVKVPILEREIVVPYGFRNGRFNLIQPVGFESANPEHAKATACRYAIEGESLYKNPDPQLGELQLLLVGRFGSGQSESRSGVERILKEHHVRLYAATEVDRLVEEIRKTAKDLPDPVASRA